MSPTFPTPAMLFTLVCSSSKSQQYANQSILVRQALPFSRLIRGVVRGMGGGQEPPLLTNAQTRFARVVLDGVQAYVP